MTDLTKLQRAHARDTTARAALLAYSHKESAHYDTGWRRWEGIRLQRVAREGEYPNYSDCSAFVTWCLWNGMWWAHRRKDTVNGAAWQAGFTGTLLAHGWTIHGGHRLTRGDVILYAYSGQNPTHAAIVVGHRSGVPMVVSHGTETGPFYLPYNYRRIVSMKRYIHKGI